MNSQLDAEIDRCAALVLVSVMQSPPERDGAISAFGQHAFAAGKLLPEAGDESMRWLLHTIAHRCVHALVVSAETAPAEVGRMVVREAPRVFDKVAAFIDVADLGAGADGLASWLRRVIEWPGPQGGES
jgi:hypothetical protein